MPTLDDPSSTTEVRRPDDGELLGSVRRDGERWLARTVFGGVLGGAESETGARAIVEREGLAALGRRWFYRPADAADWEVVVVQEAWPGRARLVLGPYALPGTPSIVVTAGDLEAGAALTLEPPTEDLAEFA